MIQNLSGRVKQQLYKVEEKISTLGKKLEKIPQITQTVIKDRKYNKEVKRHERENKIPYASSMSSR